MQSSLNVKSESSNVALCILWSEKKIISKKITKDYNVMGNLYSPGGINGIIRSLLANPTIRYLVVFGADLRGTGDTLSNFFNKGMKNRKVVDSEVIIEKEIPIKAINLLRKNVELVDMRKKSFPEINKKISQLNSIKTKAYSKSLTFEETLTSIPSIPSEHTGFVVRGKTVAQVWIKLLDLVLKFGVQKGSDFCVDQKEILNVTSVIYEKDETIPKFMSFSDAELKKYIQSVMKSKKSRTVSYTYGERLFSKNSKLVKNAILKLQKNPDSRRAIVITFKEKDFTSSHPPCLTQVIWNIKEDLLYQSVVFRSHDIYGSYPMNIFAMQELHASVAKQLGKQVGPLTCISNSAHIYENDFKRAHEVLKKNNANSKFEIDPRGVFKVELHGEDILVTHLTSDGQKTGHYFWGKDPDKLILEIMHSQLLSRMDHAAYLGQEIQKAYYALKNNKKYVQDKTK